MINSKKLTATAYIALGSNLNHPIQQIAHGIEEIQRLPNTQILAQSSFYQTTPYGPVPQPDFINSVIAITTLFEPEELLCQLQAIEQFRGRTREIRWGPRILDLDILLYDNLVWHSSTLHIPHIELKKRNFVLYPLAEIAPSLILPDGTKLTDLLTYVDQQGIKKIAAIPAGDDRKN